jgi:uncharacterized UBP type Zn finger protein
MNDPIDVGMQRSGESKHTAMGASDQCICCFRSTENSTSADFCLPCLTKLRSNK